MHEKFRYLYAWSLSPFCSVPLLETTFIDLSVSIVGLPNDHDHRSLHLITVIGRDAFRSGNDKFETQML